MAQSSILVKISPAPCLVEEDEEGNITDGKINGGKDE